MTIKHKTFIGKIMEVPCGTKSDYFFELENGDFLNLKSNDAVEQVPINTKVALCMSVDEVDGFRVVCDHVPYFTRVQ